MKKVVKIKRNADVYIKVGQKKREEGKLNEAVYYFYLACKNSRAAKNVDALVELGNAYCDIGRFYEAVEYYTQALSKAPFSKQINSLIGKAFSAMGEDDVSLFYLVPDMSLSRFNNIMQESAEYERQESGPIRVVEKNDEMTLNIAIKLFESGDSKYAVQLLEAIKPTSNQFVTACNMLALYEIEQGSLEKAKQILDSAINCRDNVLARCSQLLLLSKVNENQLSNQIFDDIKGLGIEGIIAKIESFKLNHSDKKSIALSLIRAGEPHFAIKYLIAILKSDPYDKDVMICYALCLYRCGNAEEARAAIFNAHYTYPDDAFIDYFLNGILNGKTDLGLGPRLKAETERELLNQIDKKLDIIYKGKNNFFKDKEFRQGLEWLFQAGYTVANNKASMILGQERAYRGFLRGLLLKNLDMQTKKVIVFSLLLNGVNEDFGQKIYDYVDEGRGSHDLERLSEELEDFFNDPLDEDLYDEDLYEDIDLYEDDIPVDEQPSRSSKVVRGIRFARLRLDKISRPPPVRKKPQQDAQRDYGTHVYKGRLCIMIDYFFTRLAIYYPKNMDLLFLTGYCAAFSSFVFCDSCFEERLLNATLRALKKYNSQGFDKTLIKSEEALAAALFFASGHSEISSIRQCSQLFGCSQQLVSEYLRALSLRPPRKPKSQNC